jgi:hypothetical protein
MFIQYHLLNPLGPNGYYTYHQVEHQNILRSARRMHVSLWFQKQPTIISQYNINSVVLKTEMGCVYRAVRTTFYV